MNPITSVGAARLAAPVQAVQRLGSQLASAQPVAAASTVVSLSAQGLERLGKEVQDAAGAARQLNDSASDTATALVRGVGDTVGGLVDGGVAVAEAVWEAGEDAVGAVADAGIAVYDQAAAVVGSVGSALGDAAGTLGNAASSVVGGIASAAGQVASYAAIGALAISRGLDDIV